MTPQRKVQVAVNRYGVIGKRVADAIALQDDMTLVGISDVCAEGYPVFQVLTGTRIALDGQLLGQ